MPAKKSEKESTNKKITLGKAAVKKPTAKKPAVKKAAVKKPTAKKPAVKKTVKKASVKKAKESNNYEESQFLPSIKPYTLKKNEKYMNVKQKQHFQDILESWKEQLQFEQDRTADKIQKNVSHFPGS